MTTFGKKFKTYFLTGLIFLGPVALTILVVQWIIGLMDGLILGLLPGAFHPRELFGVHIPGLGAVATVLLVLLVGILTTNIFGRTLINYSEWLFSHTPGIKGVYHLFKQVTDSLLNQGKAGFHKVVLIEYPRRGIWTVAFVTGVVSGELQRLTPVPMISVFVPTTPNPTSGFYLLLPEADVVDLQMTVDEAFKLIVSGGMVVPPDRAAIALQDEDGA